MAAGLHLARLRCTGCGECCRGPRVPVTFADLCRLTRATGLPAEELVDWGAPELLAGEPSSVVLLPSGRAIMLLRWNDGGCRFLDGAACGVHASRPAACRAYPLHATFGERGGLKRLRVLRELDCPYELDGTDTLAAVRRDHAMLRSELGEHHAALREWNRAQERRRRLGKRLAPASELFQRYVRA